MQLCIIKSHHHRPNVVKSSRVSPKSRINTSIYSSKEAPTYSHDVRKLLTILQILFVFFSFPAGIIAAMEAIQMKFPSSDLAPKTSLWVWVRPPQTPKWPLAVDFRRWESHDAESRNFRPIEPQQHSTTIIGSKEHQNVRLALRFPTDKFNCLYPMVWDFKGILELVGTTPTLFVL